MVHSNDDAMNKIPLKSASGLDDEEKNGGEFIHDTAAAEEARREQMRVNLLKWMKKLTIVLICFIGIALISYVIISLCFSDTSNNSTTSTQAATNNATSHADSDTDSNVTQMASMGAIASTSATTASTITAVPVLLLTTVASTAATAAATTSRTSTTLAAHTTVAEQAVEQTLAATGASSTTSSTEKEMTTSDRLNNTEKLSSTDATAAATHSTAAMPQDVPIVDEKFESKLGVFEKAAVCSDKTVCSEIGSNILAQGGSAVDSAIATLFCNGIATMQSMGIGGGMLMNVYTRNNKHAYSIDAREVAPYSAYPDMFDENTQVPLHGGPSIAVPGELMGYYRAHERFGKLPWKALLEPSIKLCNEGFYLSHHQWDALNVKKQHLQNNTVLTNVFMNQETGELHPIGTKLKPQQELCNTYMTLAKNGPMDFYNGTLARLVVEDLKELGSSITYDDLESYGADLVSSITMQLGDDILYAVPPISSSAVVANILSILEGFNFTKADLVGEENQALTWHRFAEAMKFGFAKRWELGDLRFNDVRELVSKLTNPEYNFDIRGRINDSSILRDIYDYGAQYTGVDDMGTAHTVVLAPNGDAVSVTSSVNDYFGAGQAGKRTGIVFNSAMNDFAIQGQANMFGLPPSPSNFIDARKRPMSSMSPMLLANPNGDIRLIVGAAGGTKIISAIVQVAARVLWFDQDIKAAVDAPRLHHQLLPMALQLQDGGFSESVIKLLESRGHKTTVYKDRGSVVCGIMRNDTAIYANADYRKQGGVAGF